jgi:hypothetical protein
MKKNADLGQALNLPLVAQQGLAVRTDQHSCQQQPDDGRQPKSIKQMQNGSCSKESKYQTSEEWFHRRRTSTTFVSLKCSRRVVLV